MSDDTSKTMFDDINGGCILGDCITEMDSLPPGIARLVIATPPIRRNIFLDGDWTSYRRLDPERYLAWTNQLIESSMRLLQPGGLLYLFGEIDASSDYYLAHVMSLYAREGLMHDLIVYNRPLGLRADSFTPASEYILVLRKDGKVFFNREAELTPSTTKYKHWPPMPSLAPILSSASANATTTS